jgi:diguanylate cyclase (GGDEF)-like protein
MTRGGAEASRNDLTGGARDEAPRSPGPPIASRVASAGIAVVLLLLAGISIWTATESSSTAREATSAGLVSDAYAAARVGASRERRLEGEYVRRPSFERRVRFDRASADVSRALDAARRAGDARERATAARLLERHARYTAGVRPLFAAARAGDAGRREAIRRGRTEPLSDALADDLATVAGRRRAVALARLETLGAVQSRGLWATLVGLPLGLSLLVALWALLRTRRRREEAVQSRLARVRLARLEREALTDDLTGLRNRRAFQEDLARELERSHRAGGPLALVLLDLDGLKQTNDALGHGAGDDRLRGLACALRDTMRGADAAYRLSGDEFAAILVGERAHGAERFTERLRTALAGATGKAPTFTAGVAEASRSTSVEVLVRRADLALIEAKRTAGAIFVHDGRAPLAPDRAGAPVCSDLRALVTALARAVDAKETGARSHSETVAETCALVAVELGLSPERITRVRLAGLLHDVGKIAVPDDVLLCPGTLTAEAWASVREHVAVGHSIVAGADLDDEAHWILHHHERLDGNGYPDGLAGDAIPLESRIILVADAFEALTAERPYRRRRSAAAALRELERHAGGQFDPQCVAALGRALGRRRAAERGGARAAV